MAVCVKNNTDGGSWGGSNYKNQLMFFNKTHSEQIHLRTEVTTLMKISVVKIVCSALTLLTAAIISQNSHLRIFELSMYL